MVGAVSDFYTPPLQIKCCEVLSTTVKFKFQLKAEMEGQLFHHVKLN